MSVRTYELTILIQPQLDEQARNALIERYAKVMEESGGAAPTINRWGMRMMTYEINRFREAFYVLYEGPMDGTKIVDVERELNYNENVLRYLFVRK